MRLVSLFAGIGGFDLGMERAGLQPVGMCEIDPHARSVLDRHWPGVPKHDDVTTLRFETFGPADVVTFGSPCQDLSVAGKRAGLDGERSGLFLEAVRYIREMLEETNGRYPRWAVWENVPGAYSSNGGADFAAVLESLVGGDVRRPAGGWANAGVAFGPLGSAEWRTLDSQYFGVPQRRRRIFLVYRPGGERAGQVLLERDGVPGHPPKGRAAGESVAGTLEARTTAGGWPGTDGAISGGLVETVGALCSADSKGVGSQYVSQGKVIPMLVPTVTASWGHHGRSSPRGDGTDPIVPVAFKVRGGKEGGGKGYLGSEDKALTISTVQEQYLAEPVAFIGGFDGSIGNLTPVAPTLVGTGEDERGIRNALVMQPTDEPIAVALAFALRGREDGAAPEVSGDRTNALRSAGGGSSRDYVTYPIDDGRPLEKRQNGLGIGAANAPSYTLDTTGAQSVATAYAVRRLTPRECERLQAFPDDHTRYASDGNEIADTHRYRMLGNAVTVNVIEWIANRIKAVTA